MNEGIVELKVSVDTNPNKLGGAIAKYLQETDRIVVTTMGEAALSNAVKGIIIAQSFLASSAKSIRMKPGFMNRQDEARGKEVTLIVFYLTVENI